MTAEDLPSFEPVARAPLSLLVSQQLREAIVSGTLAIGTRLPSEKELTERFGVSRSTIREALRILQAQGLLSGGETVSTRRPVVSDEQTLSSAAQGLEAVLRLGQVPLPDLIELRLLLEGAALEQAAAAPDPVAFGVARAALEEMRAPGLDIETFHAADVRFHIELMSAAGNAAFHLVLRVLRDAIAGHLLESLAALDDPQPVMAGLADEHTAILDAVERGDGIAARRLVTSHVESFYRQYGSPSNP